MIHRSLLTIGFILLYAPLTFAQQTNFGAVYNQSTAQEKIVDNVSTSGKTIFIPFPEGEITTERRNALSNHNIDLSSFKFMKLHEDLNRLLPPSNPYEYATSQGTYSYEPTLGKVSFSPNSNISIAEEDIYFEVKYMDTDRNGTPISGESKSMISKVTMKFTRLWEKFIIVNANPIKYE
ncbi:hypothetical protein [Myroides odoratus]|uniref:hypothetical protein n=1 Tax=Myroides odoratus TaxID=256 RepID=UPI0039B026DA